jgi:hypothetical protein
LLEGLENFGFLDFMDSAESFSGVLKAIKRASFFRLALL